MRTRKSNRKPRPAKPAESKAKANPSVPSTKETNEAIIHLQKIVQKNEEQESVKASEQESIAVESPNLKPCVVNLASDNVLFVGQNESPRQGNANLTDASPPVTSGQRYVELAQVYKANQEAGDCLQYQNQSSNFSFHLIASGNESIEGSNIVPYTWNPSGVSTAADSPASISCIQPEWESSGQLTRKTFYATAVPNSTGIGTSQTALIFTTTPPITISSVQTNCEAVQSKESFNEVAKEGQYSISLASRASHNEKERKRRFRMKSSCERLRSLVPGLGEKTDKATVLEYTVRYMSHLDQCPEVNCEHYIVDVERDGPPPEKVQFIDATITFPFSAGDEPVNESSGGQPEQGQFYQVEEIQIESGVHEESV